MQTEKLALINPYDFDVCELVPQFTVHRSKEQEKLHNIVELGNNCENRFGVNGC